MMRHLTKDFTYPPLKVFLVKFWHKLSTSGKSAIVILAGRVTKLGSILLLASVSAKYHLTAGGIPYNSGPLWINE